MRESIKAVISLLMIIAMAVAFFAWCLVDRPEQTNWILRISSPLVAVLLLALLLKIHFRSDLAHDYLHASTGSYFNRGGFCFAFSTIAKNGVCQVLVSYQNQFERPCIGRIALRPARNFFLTRAKIETITLEIPCEAAAFGIATLSIPLPREVQGKSQSFEVGASVDFPKGKGKRLRFRDGISIRANSDFGDAFRTALAVAGTFAGAIVLTNPATITVALPADVAEALPTDAAPEIHLLWKLGDPPLSSKPGDTIASLDDASKSAISKSRFLGQA